MPSDFSINRVKEAMKIEFHETYHYTVNGEHVHLLGKTIHVIARAQELPEGNNKVGIEINVAKSIFITIILSGVRLSPLGTEATTGLLYQPQMIDDGDCGAIGGMEIEWGNRNTRRKPAPSSICPPQIPQEHTSARTRAAAMGSQRLTA
jgi:hypothetical protein